MIHYNKHSLLTLLVFMCLLNTISRANENLNDLFQQSKELIDNGDFDSARVLLFHIDSVKSKEKIKVLIAYSYAREGNKEECTKIIQTIKQPDLLPRKYRNLLKKLQEWQYTEIIFRHGGGYRYTIDLDIDRNNSYN